MKVYLVIRYDREEPSKDVAKVFINMDSAEAFAHSKTDEEDDAYVEYYAEEWYVTE